MSNNKKNIIGKNVSNKEESSLSKKAKTNKQDYTKSKFSNLSGFHEFSKSIPNTKAKKTKRTETAKDILNESHLNDVDAQKKYIKKVVDELGDNENLINDLYSSTENVIKKYGFKEELFDNNSIGDEIEKIDDINEFTNYVYKLFMKAHGEDFFHETADEFIEDTIKRCTDKDGNIDWSKAVGIAKNSLGEE